MDKLSKYGSCDDIGESCDDFSWLD